MSSVPFFWGVFAVYATAAYWTFGIFLTVALSSAIISWWQVGQLVSAVAASDAGD
jgi:hypothetical protein